MTKAEVSAAARALNAMRKTYGVGTGRPKKLRPCPQCGERMGARELRAHRCEPIALGPRPISVT